MGIIGKTARFAVKSAFFATSFGLGFALFARPWPDSPFWAKPMDLVKERHKDLQSTSNILSRYSQLPHYAEFSNSSIFQECLKNENFELMELNKLIPEIHRHNQVSQGLLNLSSPIVMANRKDGELVLFGKANNDNLVGLDGKIHNGIALILLDESLCFCGFDKLPSKRGVTANLSVNLKGKIHPNSSFILSAKIQEARGRKVNINGKIESLNGDLIADAKCLLVEPRWFKWFNWVELF